MKLSTFSIISGRLAIFFHELSGAVLCPFFCQTFSSFLNDSSNVFLFFWWKSFVGQQEATGEREEKVRDRQKEGERLSYSICRLFIICMVLWLKKKSLIFKIVPFIVFFCPLRQALFVFWFKKIFSYIKVVKVFSWDAFFRKALLFYLSHFKPYSIWNWFCVWCELGVKILFFSIWLPNWPSTVFWKTTFSSPLFFNFHTADSRWICGQANITGALHMECISRSLPSCVYCVRVLYLCLCVFLKQGIWYLFLRSLLFSFFNLLFPLIGTFIKFHVTLQYVYYVQWV